MYKLIIFAGSIREGNYTQHVANFINQQTNQVPEFQAELVSLDDYDLDFSDAGRSASPKELREKVIAADGYIIVTPEYNHGYPGNLKYLLDMNLKEYIHKPVAMVGVSSGTFGGARAIELLTPVVRELGMVVTFNDVNFSNVKDEVNQAGELKDPEKWQRRSQRMLNELLWMTKTLAYGRENIEVAGEWLP